MKFIPATLHRKLNIEQLEPN